MYLMIYSSEIITKRFGGGMVDTRDLKSLGHSACAGSGPAFGTTGDNLFRLSPFSSLVTS